MLISKIRFSRGKGTNWLLLGWKGPTYYQSKIDHLAKRVKDMTLLSQQTDQLIIWAKETNWLSGQSKCYQDKKTSWLSTQNDQPTIRVKGTNWLSGQKGPTDYQGRRDRLVIMAKESNWLSGEKDQPTIRAVSNWLSEQNGPTDYQGKVPNWLSGQSVQLTIRAMCLTDYQGKVSNWLSGQKEPTDNKDIINQLTISAKGTNWQ